MNQNKWKNKAWEDSQPTKEIVDNFKKGIIKEGDRLLDIGCGFGRNSNWLASKGVVVSAININNNEIDEAMSRAVKLGVYVNYFWANAINLPFTNNDFEIVIDAGCSHLLPDKNAQQQAEREVSRILKPGRYLIYFGFSKKHPAYKNKVESLMFRDLDDIKKTYGQDFEILKVEEVSWKTRIEEKAKYSEHIGLNILMRKKIIRE